MPVALLGKLNDGLVEQCVAEVYDKFPELSKEPVDMDKFFDHEVHTVDDVNAIVKGTPFATPWENIPHLAKARCIGFFNLCKFLRKNSNDPEKVVGALRDIFSEHVGLDFDERTVTDMTRLFDDDDDSRANSRASPNVEKILSTIFARDPPEWRFRDKNVDVTGFKTDAATVVASNGEYVVFTQGLYIDVYRKSEDFQHVHTQPIEFGRVNSTPDSAFDPAIAISDNGKYIAVGVPGAGGGGEADGKIHVYKQKEGALEWMELVTQSFNAPGFGCRGSIDINDHGLLAFTHGTPRDSPDMPDMRGYVGVVDSADIDRPILYKSGLGAQPVINEEYVYGKRDDNELALMKNAMQGFSRMHHFGRHVKFVDNTARDWKIRVGSAVDVLDIPQIHIQEDVFCRRGGHDTRSFEFNNEDNTYNAWVGYGDGSVAVPTGNGDIYLLGELPGENSTANMFIVKGRIDRVLKKYSSIHIPLYYEFEGGNWSHVSIFQTKISTEDPWEVVNIHIYGRNYSDGSKFYHGSYSLKHGLMTDFTGETQTEWTVVDGHEQLLVPLNDSGPFVCPNGQVVRHCEVEEKNKPVDKFLKVYNPASGQGGRIPQFDKSPISVDSVNGDIVVWNGDIHLHFSPSNTDTLIRVPSGLERGAKTCIDVGGSEYLIGRQILFLYEKRWKLNQLVFAWVIICMSLLQGVSIAAAFLWASISLRGWDPVVAVLISSVIFGCSSLFTGTGLTGVGVVCREVLDSFIDDEKFFGKDRRKNRATLLALDSNALLEHDSSNFNAVSGMLKKFFAKGLEDFGKGVDEFANNVKDDLKGKADDIKDALEDFGEDVDEFANTVKNDLKDKADDIKDAFRKFGNDRKKDRTRLFKKRNEKRG